MPHGQNDPKNVNELVQLFLEGARPFFDFAKNFNRDRGRPPQSPGVDDIFFEGPPGTPLPPFINPDVGVGGFPPPTDINAPRTLPDLFGDFEFTPNLPTNLVSTPTPAAPAQTSSPAPKTPDRTSAGTGSAGKGRQEVISRFREGIGKKERRGIGQPTGAKF